MFLKLLNINTSLETLINVYSFEFSQNLGLKVSLEIITKILFAFQSLLKSPAPPSLFAIQGRCLFHGLLPQQ